MKHLNQQHTAIASILIFNIGLMLSCNVLAGKPPAYAIGDTGPGGGIVFHVTDDGNHGLEAAPTGSTFNKFWDDSEIAQMSSTYATKEGYFDGSFNTDRMVSTGADNAAQFCANYNGGGYGDWYLPSKDELNLMWENLADSDGDDVNNGLEDPGNIGGFVTSFYWSSTEVSETNAYAQYFSNGTTQDHQKNVENNVRPVRAF